MRRSSARLPTSKAARRATPLEISKRQKRPIAPSSGLTVTSSPLSGGEGAATRRQKPRQQIFNCVGGQGSGGTVFVLTCEHGGNRIPAAYKALFSGAQDVLDSHRGWDLGALRVAESMASRLDTQLFSSKTSRLLVELNRSIGHPSLFSEFTTNRPMVERQGIINRYWQPYRDQVTSHIDNLVQAGCRVVHLSIHSFTPIWESRPRKTSIGLLYDPRRSGEKLLCDLWKRKLKQEFPGFVIHSNQPYKGIADGFTTTLRRRFDLDVHWPGEYNGIEIEINQSLIFPATGRRIHEIAHAICRSLTTCATALASFREGS
ncbi:MAG: N-formylglutamate amidohydrolase [Planctomycetaceae bacterium]|nr:N-formylglutamate amidohydrolase [Planctomycetaceae bacterium]